MYFAETLHDLLEKHYWNLETIRYCLERDSSSINVKNSGGHTLLASVLLSKNCSLDVVKLLLQKGANVNYPVDRYGHFSPLVTAIRSSRDEPIIQVLLERGADVNQVHPLSFDETPLLFLLRNVDCSIGVVKLLLHYGADVNCKDIYGYSPLATALQNSREEAVVSMLLMQGADVNTLTKFKRSPLCIAFEHTSNNMVQLLLDAGCSPTACKYHISALHCATQYPKTGLREDILKRLLEAEANINFLGSDGQSLLCFALRNGAEAHDIELLLNEGATLNACLLHATALICATGGTRRTPLKAAVLKLLCNIPFNAELHGLSVLQNALKCSYETEAIQFLLELPGMDAYVSDISLLHHALLNLNCEVEALKLLMREEIHLEAINDYRDTPLHCAVRVCKASVIEFFLEKGCSVDAKNRFGETALTLAVKNARGSKIIQILLDAGAQLSAAKCSERSSSLLKYAFKQYHNYTVDQRACLKMVVKYFFRQNPESNIQDFMNDSCLEFLSIHRSQDFSEYSVFANECVNELQRMASMQVGPRCTLRDILSGQCLPEIHSANPNEGVKYYDFNQILKCLSEYAFPVFFDVICVGVEKLAIEAELQKLLIYTNKIYPNSHNTKRVCLNKEIVHKISGLLCNEDAMRLLLAYKGNQNISGL